MASPNKYSDFRELYDSVNNQNIILDEEILRVNNLYSTNNRKASLTFSKYQWYVFSNFFLWIIYYIVAFICIYYLYFGEKKIFTLYVKHCLCILFLIYPMIALMIEILIYELGSYMSSLLFGHPYSQGKNNKPPFSVLDIMPPGYY